MKTLDWSLSGKKLVGKEGLFFLKKEPKTFNGLG